MATVYVLCGENNYLKQKKINELKKKFLEPRTTVLNCEVYQALVDDFVSLKESLQSLSLLGQKLILVKDADRFNSHQLETIFSLAQKNKLVTLILDSDKKDFARQFSAPYKVSVETFEKIYPNKIPTWLSQRAREKGGSLSVEAAEVLAQNLGNNLQLLNSTLDTLINFVDKKKRIEKEDVEKLVGLNLIENVFEVVDAVADRDVKLALKLTNNILKTKSEPHYILAVIAWHFTRLLTAKKIMEESKNFDIRKKIQKIFSLKTFYLEKFLRQLNNFTFSQLKDSLRELLEADLKIKTLAANPQYILEVTLIRISSLCSKFYR
jgi:DNA polymerase-3 subunit delta